MAKFWLSETNLRLNQLLQYLRDCLLLVRLCCSICMNSCGSNHSICIRFRINRRVIHGKNEGGVQGVCRHSCLLLNRTDGTILRLVINHSSSSIYHHIACGCYREIMWSQNRGMILRAKNYVYDEMKSQRLLCCRQTPKSYQNEQRIFHDKLLIRLEQAIFSRGRAPHEKWLVIRLDNCPVQASRVSTDWLEEHNILRMPDPPTVFTWSGPEWLLLVSDSQRKNSNGFNWLTRTNFWVRARGFERSGSTRIEYPVSGLGAPSSRSKWRQWRLRQIINNFFILALLNFIKQGSPMYFSNKRCCPMLDS
jgi:hypothetical protein